VNENEESFQPFDLKLSRSSGTRQQTLYIEVKSTTEPTKRAFEISLVELNFAQRHPESYLVAFMQMPHVGEALTQVNIALLTKFAQRVYSKELVLFVSFAN
jgi:hypothetical protein